jgi:ribosomal protein S18 acetylase RimI-like enzyme
VSVDEGRVVGSLMAGYDGHRGWLNYLAVEPTQRRRGIARQLVRAAEELLRAVGCPKVNLQVRSSNQEVLEFYLRLGFMVDDVVSMGKRLIVDAPPSPDPAPPP